MSGAELRQHGPLIVEFFRLPPISGKDEFSLACDDAGSNMEAIEVALGYAFSGVLIRRAI